MVEVAQGHFRPRQKRDGSEALYLVPIGLPIQECPWCGTRLVEVPLPLAKQIENEMTVTVELPRQTPMLDTYGRKHRCSNPFHSKS